MLYKHCLNRPWCRRAAPVLIVQRAVLRNGPLSFVGLAEVAVSRCAVFIDGGYLNKVLENEFNRCSIDYGKLAEEVAQGTERLRTYYYHCMPYQSNPPTEEEKRRYIAMSKFVEALKRLPRYEFRQGKLARREGGFEQK